MAKRVLDAVDERLISLLTHNARLPTAALARQLGLSRSAVQERLKRLERDGVVLGYTLVLADQSPPAAFAAHVMIRLEPKLHDRAIGALRGLPEVKSCRTVSGEWDLVAEVEAQSGVLLDDVLTRIGKLPGIARTTSAIVLTTKFDRG
jgi:DNA-binding Lrp family transcriptional regulator